MMISVSYWNVWKRRNQVKKKYAKFADHMLPGESVRNVSFLTEEGDVGRKGIPLGVIIPGTWHYRFGQ